MLNFDFSFNEKLQLEVQTKQTIDSVECIEADERDEDLEGWRTRLDLAQCNESRTKEENAGKPMSETEYLA